MAAVYDETRGHDSCFYVGEVFFMSGLMDHGNRGFSSDLFGMLFKIYNMFNANP